MNTSTSVVPFIKKQLYALTANPHSPSGRSALGEVRDNTLIHGQEIIRSNGKAYSIVRTTGNPYALPVGNNAFESRLRASYKDRVGKNPTKFQMSEMLSDIRAHSEGLNKDVPTFARVAKIPGGVVIDLGDECYTQVKITAGNVEFIDRDSDVLFYRSAFSKPMPETRFSVCKDVCRLMPYVNLGALEFRMLIGWLTYTLAHPKVDDTDFVFLTLLGGQGSGKSMLSKICKDLIDPSVINAQVFPKNVTDLAISTEGSHVVCFDNMRSITDSMSDILCTVSTGARSASRKLFSDGDQYAINLHGSVIFNGIHPFVTQPDLAQRCLTFSLEPLKAEQRIHKGDMLVQLGRDMPAIQHSLFNKIAEISLFIESAEVIFPERMMGFCRWLAAMESADNVVPGTYQETYSKMLREGQLEALLENSLAAALLDFVDSLEEDEYGAEKEWSGTPRKLLEQLDFQRTSSPRRSSDWPDNEIAMARRLPGIVQALESQGVRLQLGARGRERRITITQIANLRK